MKGPRRPFQILTVAALLIGLCAGTSTAGSHSVIVDPHASTNAVRMACIGDSITAGYKLQDPVRDCYPAQLATMVGPHWNIVNFGVPAATCMAETDHPIATESTIPEALFLDPNVVVILLGTNDAKPDNWKHSARFVSDYVDLVRSFTLRVSKPSVWIATPTPVFTGGGNRPSNAIISGELIPMLLKVAEEAQVAVIDLYTPFLDKPELFPDAVHPNAAGARLIAEHVYRAITGRVPPPPPKP